MTRQLAIRPVPGEWVPRTAMVMAAGLGTRMRPLTLARPKPLIELAGRALIDHVLDRLRAAGVERVVVNVHHHPDQLEAHLREGAHGLDLAVSDERARLMETGGGLVQARALLGKEPVLVLNSDNLWVDGPVDALRLLGAQWDDEAMDALLLLVPAARAHNHRGAGDFHLGGDGRLTRRKPGRVAPFVYTGVQIIHPRLIRDWPEGPFSTNLFWDRAITEGRAFGAVHQGLWFDVGTPEAIPATEAMLADG